MRERILRKKESRQEKCIFTNHQGLVAPDLPGKLKLLTGDQVAPDLPGKPDPGQVAPDLSGKPNPLNGSDVDSDLPGKPKPKTQGQVAPDLPGRLNLATIAETLSSSPVLARQKTVVSAWPTDLVEKVSAVVRSSQGQLATPEFSFALTKEAAHNNSIILQKYGYNLGAAIAANTCSPMGYGSEFRPIDTLHSVFSLHPNWNRMKSILRRGSKWPLVELDEENRQADVNEALTFGNHKGATNDPILLRKLVEKDVTYGYSLVIPLSSVRLIPGALLAPMNIMHQNTIDENGRIILKDRLTHDQSYKWQSGTSVNSRVLLEELLPCRFGACIRRLVNYAVAARRQFPNCRILATKIDYKSAYRRCHLNWETAIQTMTQLPAEDLALISLRLTFGGAPGPFEWGVLSETICDLAHALLHDPVWNPDELQAPMSVPSAKYSKSDDIPFGVGKKLVMDFPVDDRGTMDVYIDDTIGLTVDLPGTDNVKRMERAPLLAIHTAARPIHHSEPLPRDMMAAESKLAAEGALEEEKIILGWHFDFRKLTVALPENKFVAWSEDIQSIISVGRSTAKALEQLIGRLGHLSMVIPFVYHFLSRLRDLQYRSRSRRSVAITDECKKDLHLMLYFLKKGRRGIDMNLLAYLMPTHVYHSDSCPAGLGGYCNSGFAWRYYLPVELQFRASNNLLEFLAAIITPWIDLLNGRLCPGDCALSMTDSTTAEGWLRKTNFRVNDEAPNQSEVRIEAARKFAILFTDHEIKSYSQWFPGKENIVADALSRDDDRTDSELTFLLYRFAPHQMPPNFKIVPLPNEIVSWLTSLLLKLPVNEQYREAHTRTKLGRGGDGMNIVNQSDSPMCSSTDSIEHKKSSSWERLPWLCEKEDFPGNMVHWLREQSAVPSRMWFRPSGRMDGRTPHETTILNLDGFYIDYSEHLRTKTQSWNTKERSRFL